MNLLRLECFIQLAIQCSNRVQSCLQDRSNVNPTYHIRLPDISNPPETEHEPMQMDTYWLKSAERKRRLTQVLCLYCSSGGHMILACPLRPPHPVVSAIKPSPIKINPLIITAKLTAALVTVLLLL